MRKIFILGSSFGIIKLIETIRSKDHDSEITLFSLDGKLPCDREQFGRLIAKEIEFKNIYPRSEKFFKEHQVTLVLDKTLSRINFKRNKIFTEEKVQYDYDVLIMTDSVGYRFPDIKGVTKIGVHGLRRASDLEKINGALTFMQSAVVCSDSLSGLDLALNIAKRKREVYLIRSTVQLFSFLSEEGALDWMIGLLRSQGVELLCNNGVVDVLGDSDVKAVRLKSKKVIATELLIFTEAQEDLRFCLDTGLEFSEKIKVDDKSKTNFDNVFAFDNVCTFLDDPFSLEDIKSSEYLNAQALTVAQQLISEPCSVTSTVLIREILHDAVHVFFIGSGFTDPNVESFGQFSPEQNTYKKVFVKAGIVIGAVLINAKSERDTFVKLIEMRIAFDQSEFAGWKVQQVLVSEGDSIHNIELLKEVISNESDKATGQPSEQMLN